MKSYNKILLAILISLSLFLMLEMDVFHHHIGSNSHSECPLCVLNSVITSIAILTVSTILFRPLFSFDTVIPVLKINIAQNYSSYYYPDRAPPVA